MAHPPASSRSPRLLFLFYFLFLVAYSPVTIAQETLCETTAGHFTSHSEFSGNLDCLLYSLSAKTPARGYFNDTTGSSPEQVFGHAMCKGDSSVADCQACLWRAMQAIARDCPYRKAASYWHWQATCQVRYSDESFFGSPTATQMSVCELPIVTTDRSTFNQRLGRLLDGLATRAASRSPRMFAVGEVNTSFSKIYGMAQCTRDLAPNACHSCLRREIGDIPKFCDGYTGATMLGGSCLIIFSTNLFYNATAVADPSPPPPLPNEHKPRAELKPRIGKRHIIIMVLGASMCLAIVACISIWRMKALKKTHHTEKISCIRTLLFDLSTLRLATNNFSNSNKLGEGGFGAVYKGILVGGQTIAVKRLSTSSRQGLEELQNEVELLVKQEHGNLVRLIGACLSEEKLLVYEYMPNASLDNFLFDSTKRKQLIWQLRYKIIEGVARGLLYLHEESQYKIIHRDLKASNILLDEKMNPKISDFGISRLFSGDKTHASTSRVVGTFGYMAPEYVINGQFSKKSDVFSFGVLVLEIVTGRKNSSFAYSEGSVNLLSYVWEHWTTGALQEILDPSLGDRYQRTEVLRCIQIGLLCVQQAAIDRPTMSSIVLMLHNRSMILDVPLQPAFFPRQLDIDHLPKIDHSLNRLSISDLDPQ